MKFERVLLIAFFGNYIINNIVGALVAMVPLGATASAPQYAEYFVLAAIIATAISWWYFMGAMKPSLAHGAIFGACAFLIAVVTAIFSGMAGVLTQTGSISQLITVLPNFVPFLINPSTLLLLGYWVLPAAAIGFYLQGKMATHQM